MVTFRSFFKKLFSFSAPVLKKAIFSLICALLKAEQTRSRILGSALRLSKKWLRRFFEQDAARRAHAWSAFGGPCAHLRAERCFPPRTRRGRKRIPPLSRLQARNSARLFRQAERGAESPAPRSLSVKNPISPPAAPPPRCARSESKIAHRWPASAISPHRPG